MKCLWYAIQLGFFAMHTINRLIFQLALLLSKQWMNGEVCYFINFVYHF